MDPFENEKKQLNKQLQQLQELKLIGLLANSIVHRFNNSIGVIYGYADLILKSTPSDDDNYTYLKQIIEEVDCAKDLAERMRIFTKQKRVDFQLISIHSIVEQAIKVFQESLPTSMDIQQDFHTTRATVLADAGQIQQAMINLCSNAYHAVCENGGILKVALSEVDVEDSFAEEYEYLNKGKYVKLTVSDTGCGMDQNVLRQVYDPFFTTKEASKGVGLGLSVVYEIVMDHKGEIIGESSLGEGTVFDIYLPLA